MLPRLLVTGGSGFLGSALRARAASSWQLAYTYLEHEPAPSAGLSFRCDLRDPGAVRRVVQATHPEVVIHTAFRAHEPDLESVVVRGSRAVAEATLAQGAALVHLSSDMIFDGEHPPYDEESSPSPITPYGRAKAEAEASVAQAHPRAVMVRTSLLYSLAPPDPRTAQVISDLEAGRRVTFFTDERRCPAEVFDLAAALLELARKLTAAGGAPKRAGLPPILHLAGPEPLTRWDFGVSLLEALGIPSTGVRPGTIRESGLTRPCDLTMVARHTPRELTRFLRPLATVLAEPRARL